jgi:AcrR family transcriptional regulator
LKSIAISSNEAIYHLMKPDSLRESNVQPLRSKVRAMVAKTILDAAEQVFSEGGLDARLEDVAVRAGVAVGTLYNHFTDRQALVDALLESHRAELKQRLNLVVEGTKDLPFRQQLEAVLKEVAAVSLPKCRLRLMLLQASGNHRAMQHSQLRERLWEVLGPIFEQARNRGELAPDPAGLQLQILLGLMRAVLAATQESPPLLTPEESPKVIVAAFLDGVGGGVRP